MLLRKKVQTLIQKGEKKINIAKAARKSIPTITRFVEGGNLEFSAALQITKEYFPNEEYVIINDFCDYTKLRNERTALEYYIINANYESANNLIMNLKVSGNRHDVEWATLYEIELDRIRGAITPDELIYKAENVYPETLEMKIYLSILKSYAYFDKKKFDLAEMILSEVENKAVLLKSDFIRSSFLIRIGQAIASLSLKKNDVKKCRKYNKYLTDNLATSSLLASVHHILGNSYTFENYRKALSHLKISRKMFIESNRKINVRKVENSINFVEILHSLEPSYLKMSNDTSDIHANAHYQIMKGNNDKAKMLLDSVTIEEGNHFKRGFHFYYRGELTGMDDYYFDSISEFKKTGDYFYVSLSVIALRKKGYPESLLNALRC